MSASILAQRADSAQCALALRIAQRSQSIPIPIPSDAYQGEAKSEERYLPCGPGVFPPDGAKFENWSGV